jgi:hypothetical protein
MPFRPVTAINVTDAREPDLMRRINLLGRAQGLMALTALKRFLDMKLPRTLEEAQTCMNQEPKAEVA